MVNEHDDTDEYGLPKTSQMDNRSSNPRTFLRQNRYSRDFNATDTFGEDPLFSTSNYNSNFNSSKRERTFASGTFAGAMSSENDFESKEDLHFIQEIIEGFNKDLAD